jgi:hypothetical protein
MFRCESCGACCRSLYLNNKYMHLDRGDGICKYFIEAENLCSIYAYRPIICRIDDFYYEYLQGSLDKESFYEMNKKSCIKCREIVREDK